MLRCWMWTYSHLKLAADLKLKTSRDQNCAVKLPVLTKWLCVPLAVWPEKQFIYFELKTNVPTQFKLQNIDFYNPLELFFFLLLNRRISTTKHVHFYVFHVLLLIQIEGLGCGLISVYCNMSTNHWLPPSVCAVTSGSVQDFPSFLKDAG